MLFVHAKRERGGRERERKKKEKMAAVQNQPANVKTVFQKRKSPENGLRIQVAWYIRILHKKNN